MFGPRRGVESSFVRGDGVGEVSRRLERLSERAIGFHLILRASARDGGVQALLVEEYGFHGIIGVDEEAREGAVGVPRLCGVAAPRVRLGGDEGFEDERHVLRGNLLLLLVRRGVDEAREELLLGGVIVADAITGGGEVVEVDEGVGAARDEGARAQRRLGGRGAVLDVHELRLARELVEERVHLADRAVLSAVHVHGAAHRGSEGRKGVGGGDGGSREALN